MSALAKAFSCGGVLLASCALWWAAVLLGFCPPHAALAPTRIHGLVMTFAFMPLFFAGFFASAGAKWLGQPPIPASRMAFALGLQSAGWLLVLLATPLPDPRGATTVAALGLSMATLGWSRLWLRFVALLRTSSRPDRLHAGLIVSAGGVGALALLAATLGMWFDEMRLERAAVQLALWLFEGCTFAAAAHRMIPFLGGAAFPALDSRRPQWLLEALAALFVLEGVTGACEALAGPLPAFAQWTRLALEGIAGAALLALAVRWGLVQDLRIRLLAMLRLGVAWLGVAFVLLGLSHALSAGSAGRWSLGAAPLHAYTMGFLGTTMLAMVSRFICGETGRAVAADDFLWALFWLLQATVVARVVGAVMASFALPGAGSMIAAAALGWAGACTLWAWRALAWLARPRLERPHRPA